MALGERSLELVDNKLRACHVGFKRAQSMLTVSRSGAPPQAERGNAIVGALPRTSVLAGRPQGNWHGAGTTKTFTPPISKPLTAIKQVLRRQWG